MPEYTVRLDRPNAGAITIPAADPLQAVLIALRVFGRDRPRHVTVIDPAGTRRTYVITQLDAASRLLDHDPGDGVRGHVAVHQVT